jgi:Cu/Ag efflux protein CusF
MKTKVLHTSMAVCVSVLTMAGALTSAADDTATNEIPHKSYTDTIVSVDAKEHVLVMEGFFANKTFNLGDKCTYTFADKGAGTIGDLHPGQRVEVDYQEAHDVLVADCVTQETMSYEGTVKACDPAARTITLHGRGRDKTLPIGGDCKVMLRKDKLGSLADIQPGNYVTVIYETPDGKPTAQKIIQTSETYTGTLTAIDLETKTVKARSLYDTKKFNLGDNCAIVIEGRINGRLADLKPNDKLVFSYDEINGVNVANRIALVGRVVQATEAPPTNQ